MNKKDLVPISPLTPEEGSAFLPDAPKPFIKDIYLFDTHIAGTSYIDNIEELVNNLNIGDEVCFFRESKNEVDDKAIVIKTINKEKLGYVPRIDNIVFSRLMDAGKLLIAKIEAIEKLGFYYRINIKIYMRD